MSNNKSNPMGQFEKKPTRAKAIKAKCFECVGYDADKGWQSKIRDCNITSCPLHRFRPYQRKASDSKVRLPVVSDAE